MVRQFYKKVVNIIIKIGLSLGFSLALLFILLQALPPPSFATPILSVSGTGSSTSPGQETSYVLALLNHTDQIVYDGLLSATLALSFTYVPSSTIILGESGQISNQDPLINGQTLTWGPFHLPAAGTSVHNPRGIHTMMDSCDGIPALHLEGAKQLTGSGGYVTQLFYPLDSGTTGPSQCAINYVNEIYARNLIPIIRLQGYRVDGVWQAPGPGPTGNYAEIAQAYARYVAGLPLSGRSPLYIAVWNEPDLWIEWSGQPNANQYARFFVAVSQAIRQLGDPRIRIVNGALTPGNMAFLEQMLQVPGFRDAFDVWASHCYPYNHPASYNIHTGSARYGTYAIDCYLEETARIQAYGRTNFKVILTETGYPLGDNTFGFEGYPPINESNRADYMAAAYRDYWENWPEIVAVTPFELTDPSGHWSAFDWVYPSPPYLPHAQYEAVQNLPSPAEELEPYGYQVIFRARVATDVLVSTVHTLQLSGSDRAGHVVSATNVAPVTILDAATLQSIYLPLIIKSLGNSGPWYVSMDQPASSNPSLGNPSAGNTSVGAIVPDHILQTTTQASSNNLMAQNQSSTLILAGQPQALTLPESTGLAAVILSNGFLQIINLTTQQSLDPIRIGNNPQAIVNGPPGRAQVYVSLINELVQVDLRKQQILNRQTGLGRVRGLAWDPVTKRLLVAAAEQEQLLVFNADLSQQVATYPLDHQPDQLILDKLNRKLYLSFPGVSQIGVFDADTFEPIAQTSLVGGPLLDMAFAAKSERLYVLHVLAPNYHGITLLDPLNLKQIALLTGSAQAPLQSATAITIDPQGNLILAEGNSIRQIAPQTYLTTKQYHTTAPLWDIQIDHNNGAFYTLERQSHLLRIYP